MKTAESGSEIRRRDTRKQCEKGHPGFRILSSDRRQISQHNEEERKKSRRTGMPTLF